MTEQKPKHENGYCDPYCPFLHPQGKDSNYTGYCSKLDLELDWCDFWLALCEKSDD